MAADAILTHTSKVFLNPVSADGGQKCPTAYNFLYIFQTTCTIILKFWLSSFYLFPSRKSKTWKFCSSEILLATPILQMGMNKIFTFLYIKIFIVSIGVLVSYLILECLCMFTYDGS